MDILTCAVSFGKRRFLWSVLFADSMHFLKNKQTQIFSFLCRLLEELMVSLQWGRQQTYYPSAQPYTTTELATVNCKLAKAVSSHLLGNVGTSSPKKTSTAVEFCNTPAEKMAERVRTLHISPSVITALGCVAIKQDFSFWKLLNILFKSYTQGKHAELSFLFDI